MAGGFITKAAIAGLLFTMFVTFGTVFLVTMGNDYGVSMEDVYKNSSESFQGMSTDLQSMSYDAEELQRDASIDSQSQDVGQVQGAISSEKTKLNTYSVAKRALDEINGIMPFSPFVTYTLLAILTIAFGAGVYYMLRGVLP